MSRRRADIGTGLTLNVGPGARTLELGSCVNQREVRGMCGICGWVDYDRDLRQAGAGDMLAAMTATMARRGPDDEGRYADTHAALGHRRLAVIDLPGGRQPMRIAEDGRPDAAVLV
jgi:hypothetical protein